MVIKISFFDKHLFLIKFVRFKEVVVLVKVPDAGETCWTHDTLHGQNDEFEMAFASSGTLLESQYNFDFHSFLDSRVCTFIQGSAAIANA